MMKLAGLLAALVLVAGAHVRRGVITPVVAAGPSVPTLYSGYPALSSTSTAYEGSSPNYTFTIPATSGPAVIAVAVTWASAFGGGADETNCTSTLSGGGLTWTKMTPISSGNSLDVGIWWTYAPSAISTTTLAHWSGWGAGCNGGFNAFTTTTWAFRGACTASVGAYTAYYNAFTGVNFPLTTIGASNAYVVWGIDANASSLVAFTGNTFDLPEFDVVNAGAAIAGHLTALTSSAGTVTLGSSTGAAGGWVGTALEIKQASCL
jgi:hypothetical protein